MMNAEHTRSRATKLFGMVVFCRMSEDTFGKLGHVKID